MNHAKRVLFLFVAFFVFCSVFYQNGIEAFAARTSGTIIGSVSLPNQALAPYDMDVTIELFNQTDETFYDSTTETILQGENKVSFLFSSLTPQDGYYVLYSLSDANYFPFGYYSSTGTTFNENSLETMNVTNFDFLDCDITLLSKTVAPTLTANQNQTGTLTDDLDVNYFTFTPNATQNYVCETSGNLDTYGEIYDSYFNQVTGAWDDDMNVAAGLTNFRIFTELQAGETYYVRVKCYSGATDTQYGIAITTNDPSSLDKDLLVRSSSLTDGSANTVTKLQPYQSVKAQIEVTNISDSPKQGALVMILYNGNKFEKMQFVNQTIESGYTVTLNDTMTMPDVVAGKKLRVLFWNNMNDMQPYAKVIHEATDTSVQ